MGQNMNSENNIMEKFRTNNNNIGIKIALNGVILHTHTIPTFLIAGSLICKVSLHKIYLRAYLAL
jgi:hypothetical protein